MAPIHDIRCPAMQREVPKLCHMSHRNRGNSFFIFTEPLSSLALSSKVSFLGVCDLCPHLKLRTRILCACVYSHCVYVLEELVHGVVL